MIREILQFGDERLRAKSVEVDKFDEELWTLLDDMYETMSEAGGVGIAAPQIGVHKRVIVIDVDDNNGVIELINPVITCIRGKQRGEEGCLSYTGKSGIVTRPAKVRLTARDRYGRKRVYWGRELLARAFCHEVDHLNGILYSDKVEEWIEEKEDD